MYSFDPSYDHTPPKRSERYPAYVIVANPGDPLPESASNGIPGPGPLVRSVHCYTDACVCYKTGIAAGAYVIGKADPVAFVVNATDSTIAELMAMLGCLKAVEQSDQLPVTLHIDLPHIGYILARQRNAVRAELKKMADRLNVQFVADGRKHVGYQQCHRAAGIMAGKYGMRHPQKLSQKLSLEGITTEIVNRKVMKQRQKESDHDRLIQGQLLAARSRANRIKLKGGL